MSGGVTIGGRPRPPAARLYAMLVDEVAELGPGDRLLLARALAEGGEWEGLPPRLRAMFVDLSQKIRETL